MFRVDIVKGSKFWGLGFEPRQETTPKEIIVFYYHPFGKPSIKLFRVMVLGRNTTLVEKGLWVAYTILR